MSGPRGADPDVPPGSPASSRPPRPIVLAAAVVVLEGLALLAAAVVLAVAGGLAAFGAWGFLVLLGVAVTGAGAALLRGVRGGRGPALVLQLLLLGVAFYAAVPSARPELGVPVALVAAGVLAGLLSRAGREWAES